VPLPERVVSLHQRGRLVNSGVVNQAVQAAELQGSFDGAGPISFRGHIVPDEVKQVPMHRHGTPEEVAQLVAHSLDAPCGPLFATNQAHAAGTAQGVELQGMILSVR
jgi:hypothetical protein